MLGLLNPGFKAIHHDPPDRPVECAVLLAQHFLSASLSTCFNVPDYDDWMLAADAHAAYAYHRQVLQVLQSAVSRTVAAQVAGALASSSTRWPTPIPTPASW